MAKTKASPQKAATVKRAGARPTDVAEKAAAVAKKVAALRHDLALAHGLAHDAQVREALTRTELTLALNEALKGRAEAQASARRDAAARLAERAGELPRPANRNWRRMLLRLGLSG